MFIALYDITQINELIWMNPFFYLFLASLFMNLLILLFLFMKKEKMLKESKIMQKQHTAKIDKIVNEHLVSLEMITTQMINRENDRNRMWVESEKEVLTVLSGVSTLLDITNNKYKVNNKEIINEIRKLDKTIKEIWEKRLKD